MKANFFSILILIILLTGIVFIPEHTFAHEFGSIKGKITTAESNQPIAFANIKVQGTLIGVSSDINGQFFIRNIPAHTYKLVVSSLGYRTDTVEIVMNSGAVIQVDIQLKATIVDISEVSVVIGRPYSSASVKEFREIDMEIRQNRTAQDFLLLVPGLVTTQHQGGGKAEQVLVRGFDCDHGTDVNISVDGIPVNLVTQAHGQGYADLHFIIPEVMDDMEITKGPYFAELGDFSTAASMSMKTKDILENNLVKLEAGQFNSLKTTLLYQIDNGGQQENAYLGAQYSYTDGAFEMPQKFQRLNLFGKYFTTLSENSRLTVSLSSFTSGWDASGQIPKRAVEQNLITRFGAIDYDEGGTTGRQNINLEYLLKNSESEKLSIQAFYSRYNFLLFSNFTLFLNDTVNGDMIEQTEDRSIYGMNGRYEFTNEIGRSLSKTTFGGGFRTDDINVALWHSPHRVRMENFALSQINQNNFSIYLKNEMVMNTKFRIISGLREDYFLFKVDDLAEAYLEKSRQSDITPHASGYYHQSIVSPKLNFVFSPNSNINVYLNSGIGFHSNDARGVIIAQKIKELEKYYETEGLNGDQITDTLINQNFDYQQRNITPLPRAYGTEIGVSSKLMNNIYFNIAFWYLQLEKEIVYAGDGGSAELSNPTERKGIDIEVRIRVNNWLWASASLNYAKGRILDLPDGENYIPLAPPVVSKGGLDFVNIINKNIDCNLSYRYVSDRPSIEDNSRQAPGHMVMFAGISYTYKKLKFSVFGENLFNTEWNEAQFDTESRLIGESSSVTELHYTPGNPRNFQFSLSYIF